MTSHRYGHWLVTLGAALTLQLAGSALDARPVKPRLTAPATAPAPAVLVKTPPAEVARSGQGIQVTVVEVAGRQAYLKPGAAGGVTRGAVVSIDRREYPVAQATDSFAMIVVGDDPIHEHDTGRATRAIDKTETVTVLTKPAPLARWAHAWPSIAPPASSQAPRFVPLGGAERDRRWDVRMSASTGALLPLGSRGSNLARVELAARVHAQPFDAPLTFDFDGTLQRWFDRNLSARGGAEARPTVLVRELRASYVAASFAGSVGRMRYAASTLGTLDGLRVTAPLGAGFSLGAFGGMLPDPLRGTPSSSASRFGFEASYSRPDLPMRPDVALVLHGSRFEGQLDERRVSGAFSIYPGPSRLGAHFELSSFDASNPWHAAGLELTAAGLDTSVRRGVFQLQGRFDVRRPERSRWLASYLPASWFCTTSAPPAGAPASAEACDGSVSTRAYGSIDAGVQLDRASMLVGVTTTGDLTQSGASSTAGAFAAARVLRIAGVLRIEATGSYSRATYLDMVGASAGPGLTLFGDALDVSVHYRLTSLQYRSDAAALVQSALGGAMVVIPGSDVLMAAQGELITGADARALVLLGTVSWRPTF